MADAATTVHAGLGVMNYRFLPTGAFDQAGNLQLPEGLGVPASWNETVGQVTASPDWISLLQILGVMTVPGTDYSCWKVAVSFHDARLRVVLIRGVDGANRNPQVGLNWSDNVWSQVLVPLRAYAGRRKVLPAWLGDALTEVSTAITGSEYWNKPLADEQAIARRELQKWRVTAGLGLLMHVAKLASTITTSSRVLATVLWYDAKQPSMSARDVAWAPLHRLYDAHNIRAIHYRWNTTLAAETYPFIYGADVKRRGWGVTDVAHQPWELARAFYPNGNWPDLDAMVLAEYQNARPRCRRVKDWDGTWTTECDDPIPNAAPPPSAALLAAAAAARPADLAAFAARGIRSLMPADEEDDVRESTVAAPVVEACATPATGGQPLGPGRIVDDAWIPDDAIANGVPETVWLPSLGRVAEFDGFSATWRPSAFVPAVTLASTPLQLDVELPEEMAEKSEDAILALGEVLGLEALELVTEATASPHGHAAVKLARGELPARGGTKYQRYFGLGDVDWCALFVSWAVDMSGNRDRRAPWANPAWVPSIHAWAQSRDRLVKRPAHGDIFGLGGQHTGLVAGASADGSTIYTIEGNISDAVVARRLSTRGLWFARLND
jgi:hypothetical protein